MSEAKERKAKFTEVQKGLYDELEKVLGDFLCWADIDEPEIQEVLFVLEDEWLEESSKVLEAEEFDYEFESIVENLEGTE